MRTRVKVWFASFAVGLLAMPAWAQDSPPVTLQDAINGYESVTDGHAGLIDDWSTHHLIFSQTAPGTAAYEKVTKDPRYWMQLIRRSQSQSDLVLEDGKAKKDKKKKVKPIKIDKDWTMDMQGTASTALSYVFPTKYVFYPSGASCANDFVVFVTGQTPNTSSPFNPTIVAFNNLYSGCSGSVPTVAWSYNTSAINTTAITTSPVLSLSGSQVAFAQGADLVLLKWSSGAGNGTLTSAVQPTNETTASAYNTCTAPCMFHFALNNADTYSSPFYSYAGDTLYVGDNGGDLYKFNPVFNATPAEITTNWPVTGKFDASGSATVPLGSPVLDSGTSGNVFVNDMEDTGTGYLYRVSGGATPGTPVATDRLENNGSSTYKDTALVDSSAQEVYYSSANDGDGNSGVFQLTTTFASDSTGTEQTIGSSGGSGDVVYSGTFDNAYFSNTGTATFAGTPVSGDTLTVGATAYKYATTTCTTAPCIVLSATTTTDATNLAAAINNTCSGASQCLVSGANASATASASGSVTTVTNTTASAIEFTTNLSTSVVTLYPTSATNGIGSPSSPSGSLYVCGNAGGDATLYRIPINGNTTTAASTGPALTTMTVSCSPVTEFDNGTDLIFLSVQDDGSATAACGTGNTGGCLMSFNVTSGTTPTTSASHLAQTGSAGTTGVIIDNDVTSPSGGEQVYFSPLSNQTCAGNGTVGSGTGPCATQASQSAL
jgi:hypothetical protein